MDLNKIRQKKLFPVEMPDWDCTVYMFRISVAELSEIQKNSDSELDEMQACKRILKYVCDETGKPLFADEAETDDLLKQCSHIELKPIIDAFNEINGFVSNEKKS